MTRAEPVRPPGRRATTGPCRDLIEVLGARSGVVCLVGAGGKKSTMYRIAAAHTGRVALTSTVHTPPFRKRLAAESLTAPDAEIESLVAGSGRRVVAYASPSSKRGRLAGVDPGRLLRIHESCGFDLTLVKADGARLRWIKAPGEHEPVLPVRFDTLIPLVSVRAVGAPLDEVVAHRPERIARLVGASLGEAITAVHVARLLAHSDGGMKYAERAARVVPVINMVDSDEHRNAARRIAEQLLREPGTPRRVVLARMVAECPVVDVIER